MLYFNCSHAPRGNSFYGASASRIAPLERWGMHSHAERGNDFNFHSNITYDAVSYELHKSRTMEFTTFTAFYSPILPKPLKRIKTFLPPNTKFYYLMNLSGGISISLKSDLIFEHFRCNNLSPTFCDKSALNC
jgi:hypothetical protein